MRRIVLSLILVVSFAGISAGQDYGTALGFRFGTGAGVTIKHFISRNSAIEGLLLTRWSGFELTGLYEVHHEAFDTERLKWLYGGGAHLGFYDGNRVEWGDPGYAYNIFGIDGIIGLEYSFREVPINLGLDLKPALNFIGYSAFWTEFGFSVRYTF
jgi:hypothetical protein